MITKDIILIPLAKISSSIIAKSETLVIQT